MNDTAASSYHHGNLREALLQQAEQQLAEVGVEKLSLRAMARSVGVSQTAPYRHFRDKNTLLAALATDGFERLYKAALGSRDELRDRPIDALVAMGMTYVRYAQQHPEIFKLMFGPMLRPRRDYPELFAAGRKVFKGLQDIVEWGLSDGLFRTDASSVHLTNTFWAGVHGVATLSVDRADTFGYHTELKTQAELSLRVFIDGLCTHRE